MTSNEKGYILSSGPVTESCIEWLKPYGEIVISPTPSEESILELISDARAYIVRGDGIANRRIIEAGTRLEVIGRTGAGFESVDLSAARERNIPVVNTPGVNARSVAEGALAFIMYASKHLGFYRYELLKGNWQSRHVRKPKEIIGSTVGIVGFGLIGKELSVMMHYLGAEVLFYDPFVSEESGNEFHASKADLYDLLERSDYVSLHVVLTEQTKNMIDEEALSHMKDGACLINLARGGVVKSLDLLYENLLNGKLSMVGIDVFDKEPPDVSHPLFSHWDCIATPHVVGMTDGAVNRSFAMLSADFERVFKGQEPKYRVDIIKGN